MTYDRDATQAVPQGDAVAKHLGLVQQVVARFLRKLPPNVLKDDLMAAGTYGLMASLQRNGGDGGAQFEGYARIRIRGAILDELRTQDPLPRRARRTAPSDDAGRAGEVPNSIVGIEDLPASERAQGLVDVATPSPAEAVEAASERAELVRAMARLCERDRTIVEMHYFQDIQLKDIGRRLGVSEPRMSQLHSRAIERLRDLVGARRCAA